MKFAMTAAGSAFVSTLFFEYNGVAPATPGGINCEAEPPANPLVVGLISLVFKTCAVFGFAYLVQRRVVKAVKTPRQKRRIIRCWFLKELIIKGCALAYIAFCGFYLLAFSTLIPERAFQAYYQAMASSTFVQFVVSPLVQVVLIFPILALPETCAQLIEAFPFLCDFSHEYEVTADEF